ncbi:MAG TPA: ATP-binding protein [Rhizobiaceae bacterium]|nr:ATP-binding protein [Rhizobiaceae bacterium]
MIKTFHMQTLAVMLGTNIAALLLSLVLVSVLVIRPAAETGAKITADVLNVLARSLDRLESAEQVMVLQILDEQEHLSVKVASTPPRNMDIAPSLYGRFFLQALKQQPGDLVVPEWRLDDQDRFWMRLPTDDPPVWVSIRTRNIADPIRGLLGVSAIALLAAFVGGIALQRRVARPLTLLEQQVDRMENVGNFPVLEESGPRELAAVSRALNRMMQRIRQAETDRTIMLAGVSHDLRTPLTKLRLSLAMLGDVDPELVGGAQRQVDRIETMLEQFLDHARGFEQEPEQRVRIGEILQPALEMAGATGRVETSFRTDLAVTVKKDALVRAIGNLLANAFVHGAPPVRVSAEIEDGDLVLEVTDGGPGMDTVDAEALVRPFARGNSARTGDGAGLGLAIADQVARAHGGSLSFSRSQNGFTATIRIPNPGPAMQP